jgi:hypothetical protein
VCIHAMIAITLCQWHVAVCGFATSAHDHVHVL